MLEPINKQDRVLAQRKFFGVYLLALIIPIVATYFWTRSTNDKLQSESEQFKKLFILMGRVDTLGVEMNKLYAVDRDFNASIEAKEFSSASQSSIKQSEDIITTMMVKVRSDSASLLAMMQGDNKAIASGIMKNYNIYYDFWKTMKARGEALKKGGIDMSELDRLRQELQMAQMAEKNADNQLRMALASKGGGGGGGGGSSCEKYIEENIELKAKVRDFERRIKEMEGKPAPATPATVVVTNNADINLLEARRMFVEADCDKKRAEEGRKRKSKKEIEDLYNDSYKKFKDLIEKTTNAEIKTLAMKRMEEIKRNLKNIPPED